MNKEIQEIQEINNEIINTIKSLHKRILIERLENGNLIIDYFDTEINRDLTLKVKHNDFHYEKIRFELTYKKYMAMYQYSINQTFNCYELNFDDENVLYYLQKCSRELDKHCKIHENRSGYINIL